MDLTGPGDATRINLIIAAATELVDNVLNQVRTIMDRSDHSTADDDSLAERDTSIIDGSLDISPRGLIDGVGTIRLSL